MNTNDHAARRRAVLLSVLDGAMEELGALGTPATSTTGVNSAVSPSLAMPPNSKSYDSTPMSFQTSTLLRTGPTVVSPPPPTTSEHLLLAMAAAAEKKRQDDAMVAKFVQSQQYQRRNQLLLAELVRSQQLSLVNQMSLVDPTPAPATAVVPAAQDPSAASIFTTANDATNLFPGTKMTLAQVAVLQQLGTSTRRPGQPYIDVSQWPAGEDRSRTANRGGVQEPFPEKVYRMLLETEKEGRADICGFYSHGRGFGIHDSKAFVAEILPRYFKQSTLNSFCRQLNLYGFTRIRRGQDAGGWYHELFLKNKPTLMTYMRRVGVPKAGQDRRKTKPRVSDFADPDFYQMSPITTTVASG